MIKEAEEKANEAMKNLTLTSIIRYANHGLEQDDSTMIKTGVKPKDSQETLKSEVSKEKSNTDLKEKESVNDIDKKRENSYGSMSNDSTSRLRMNGNHQKNDVNLNEDMEEDQILARECINSASSRSPVKHIES
jgi:hypothetical protein